MNRLGRLAGVLAGLAGALVAFAAAAPTALARPVPPGGHHHPPPLHSRMNASGVRRPAMGSIRAWAALACVVTAIVAGCSGPPSGVGPGDKVGTMTLESGTASDADLNFFDFCNPVILKPGNYLRSCAIPRAQRLLIGYGDFEPTRKALESDWKKRKWDLWVDGRRVNLAAFGTYDHTLVAFPAAGGKDVILRRWKVILVGVTPGKHTVRYRSQGPSVGTTDATWAFSVAKD